MLSHDALDSCYLEFLASPWAEMEAILAQHCAENAARADARERAGLRLEALLLELALLRDKCEFLRWRGLLAPEQAAAVRVVVNDLHALLDVEPFDSAWPRAGTAIVRAQNRLFDEVQRIAQRTAGTATRRVRACGEALACGGIMGGRSCVVESGRLENSIKAAVAAQRAPSAGVQFLNSPSVPSR
jgi:hypothetical protein